MQNEHRIVKLLVANGLDKAAARVLACYETAEDDDELTSMDLEHYAQLRQPEVSIGTSHLIERGWLACRTRRKAEGRGRPINLYRLAMPMRDIVREIVRERNREIDRQQEMAAQLLQAVA